MQMAFDFFKILFFIVRITSIFKIFEQIRLKIKDFIKYNILNICLYLSD